MIHDGEPMGLAENWDTIIDDMVQKTGIIVQKKNYTLRTWQTEDVASLAQYLNNKNIWDKLSWRSPLSL